MGPSAWHMDRTSSKADWQIKNGYEQLVAAELAWVAVLGLGLGLVACAFVWLLPSVSWLLRVVLPHHCYRAEAAVPLLPHHCYPAEVRVGCASLAVSLPLLPSPVFRLPTNPTPLTALLPDAQDIHERAKVASWPQAPMSLDLDTPPNV
jgi:hypothetical protein